MEALFGIFMYENFVHVESDEIIKDDAVELAREIFSVVKSKLPKEVGDLKIERIFPTVLPFSIKDPEIFLKSIRSLEGDLGEPFSIIEVEFSYDYEDDISVDKLNIFTNDRLKEEDYIYLVLSPFLATSLSWDEILMELDTILKG